MADAHGKAAARARLVIRIPRHPRGLSKRAQYISASTKSASIAIGPAPGCTTCSPAVSSNVALAAGSAGCTNSPAAVTCTFAYALSPGSYVGSITTFDGALNGSNKPTGNVLSLNQSFPLTIVAGQANAPSIVLSGVPVAATFMSLTNSLVVNGTQFEMVGGDSTATLAAYALDADGNVILGAGAPSFSASASGGFTATASSSAIALHAPATMTKSFANLVVTANSPACAVSGAVCTYNGKIGFDPLVAIANSASNNVLILPAFAPGVYATVSSGIGRPVSVAFDATGNLFVLNQQTATVTKYAPPYTGAPIATIDVSPPISAQAVSMTFAPNGTLAIAYNAHDIVTTYAASTYTKISSPSFTSPVSAAFDNASNLWVGPFGPNAIGRILAPAYATSDISWGSSTASPSVVFDKSDNMYIAYQTPGVFEYAAPSYTTAPHSIVSGIGTVSGLAADNSDGLLAVCTDSGMNVYSTPALAPLSQNPATAACTPAFDRDETVWTLYPSLGVVAAYRYLGASWALAGVVGAPALNLPAAIAAYPAP